MFLPGKSGFVNELRCFLPSQIVGDFLDEPRLSSDVTEPDCDGFGHLSGMRDVLFTEPRLGTVWAKLIEPVMMAIASMLCEGGG